MYTILRRKNKRGLLTLLVKFFVVNNYKVNLVEEKKFIFYFSSLRSILKFDIEQ